MTMAADAASDAPRPDDPEQVIRTYWNRIWLERDLGAIDDLVVDPLSRHTIDGSVQLSATAFKAHLADALGAVRSCEMSVDALSVDGPTVWVRLTLQSISLATMTPMALTYMSQYRVEHGRIAEVWQLHSSGLDWHDG